MHNNNTLYLIYIKIFFNIKLIFCYPYFCLQCCISEYKMDNNANDHEEGDEPS